MYYTKKRKAPRCPRGSKKVVVGSYETCVDRKVKITPEFKGELAKQEQDKERCFSSGGTFFSSFGGCQYPASNPLPVSNPAQASVGFPVNYPYAQSLSGLSAVREQPAARQARMRQFQECRQQKRPQSECRKFLFSQGRSGMGDMGKWSIWPWEWLQPETPAPTGPKNLFISSRDYGAEMAAAEARRKAGGEAKMADAPFLGTGARIPQDTGSEPASFGPSPFGTMISQQAALIRAAGQSPSGVATGLIPGNEETDYERTERLKAAGQFKTSAQLPSRGLPYQGPSGNDPKTQTPKTPWWMFAAGAVTGAGATFGATKLIKTKDGKTRRVPVPIPGQPTDYTPVALGIGGLLVLGLIGYAVLKKK